MCSVVRCTQSDWRKGKIVGDKFETSANKFVELQIQGLGI
jgi:hypothetical protein